MVIPVGAVNAAGGGLSRKKLSEAQNRRLLPLLCAFGPFRRRVQPVGHGRHLKASEWVMETKERGGGDRTQRGKPAGIAIATTAERRLISSASSRVLCCHAARFSPVGRAPAPLAGGHSAVPGTSGRRRITDRVAIFRRRLLQIGRSRLRRRIVRFLSKADQAETPSSSVRR